MVRRFLAIALLAACTHKTPEEQLQKDFETVKSWSATVQFAGEKWSANSVPAAFVRATIDAAEKEYEKAGKAIDASQAPKDLRDQLHRELDVSRAAAERLKRKVS
jgi:hypothetical protein